MQRRLLSESDNKVSYLQIIGFAVILFGLVYLFIEQIAGKLNGDVVSITFFTIMLGIALAFPDLLKDPSNNLSTMRIGVFMMINVVSLLLLKIGWEQTSLKNIGFDQYWMGIIAFIFGAKATQSYFESKISALANAQATASANPQNATGTNAINPVQQATGTTSTATNEEDLDGCGITPTQLTTDAGLPASKGGMA
ncbi:MAG TPA: hypothetical protein VHC47_07205 [Mucilaginibacter sp.]|nr:hypothetical protein [Mucilaginibacter sp.]